MPKYQFNINEGSNSATLTVTSNDEQSAIQQAQQLLKSSDSLGTPEEVTEQESQAE
jgi:hypothetical protein